jgi:hypothetical protein
MSLDIAMEAQQVDVDMESSDSATVESSVSQPKANDLKRRCANLLLGQGVARRREAAIRAKKARIGVFLNAASVEWRLHGEVKGALGRKHKTKLADNSLVRNKAGVSHAVAVSTVMKDGDKCSARELRAQRRRKVIV